MSTTYRRQLAELAETLHAERQLLEHLLFKLIEARLVLAADEARFVPQAMREVEAVVERVRFGEGHRHVAVQGLANAIGEPPERITLGFLVGWAPEPYKTMFSEHQDHFRRLATEIEQASLDNRRLASLAVQNLSETLGSLLGSRDPGTYTHQGTRGGTTAVLPTRLDEVL
ncbi:MAG: flagellar protein FlgN [Acidimicrobiia bacterium]|nr:flagellar protein FlgN [Acidimicrobiia bacterium]MDH4308861.1 flagellar protein FlgN [Acidimicrobiia bacterium]